jgi:Methyltransferase FkbM domain
MKSIKVAVRKLDTLLREHAPDVGPIDLLSIDVDGWELSVLRGLDLRLHPVSIAVIENLFGEPEYGAFMRERGFAMRRRVGPNEIYLAL